MFLEAIFAKRRQMALFQCLGCFDYFWRPKTAFAPKKRKKYKIVLMTKKHHFRCERKTVIIVRFWARFWSPNLQNRFFTFGPTFAFWRAFGGKSAPEAENVLICIFWLPKVGKSLFCDSGRKRVPKTLWIQRVLRFWRKGVKMMFSIFQHKFMFLCRASNNILLVFHLRTTTCWPKIIFFAPSAKQWKT